MHLKYGAISRHKTAPYAKNRGRKIPQREKSNRFPAFLEQIISTFGKCIRKVEIDPQLLQNKLENIHARSKDNSFERIGAGEYV